MSRSAINFILDTILALFFLALIWVQFILTFLFPLPSSTNGWSLWGLSYDGWSRASFWCFFAFAVLVLIHVMLHWSWVCGIVVHRVAKWKGRKVSLDPSTETLVGVGILVGILHLLGALYLVAMLTIRSPETEAGGRSARTVETDRSLSGLLASRSASGGPLAVQ